VEGEKQKLESFKDLQVWQKAYSLVVAIYKATGSFPGSETYGLVAQMRRAAVSVPCNIAEGYRRNSRKEYLQFLAVAYGSTAELETQLLLARDLGLLGSESFSALDRLVSDVSKLLSRLINALRSKRQHGCLS
jgi:four helix bundle protein